MKQKQSLSLLRIFELVGLLLFFSGGLFLLWWHYLLETKLMLEAIIAVVASLIGLGVYFYTGNIITRKIDILTAQSDFSAEAQFLALFERSPVPYIIIDSNGIITKINQVAVNYLRSHVDDLMNTNLFDWFISSSESDISIVTNKLRSGMTLNEVEVELELAGNQKRWVLLSSYQNPQTKEIFVSLVDITQAKKVDAAKSEFLALATHQLRTPIAAIRWNTELLGKRIPDEVKETTNHYVNKIQSNTNRMSTLIDDFLNVSKLEMGTFATEPKPLNMTVFLNDIVDEFGQKLEEKQIKLERNEQPINFELNTDERLLHIIVSNLLSNATKYVKPSGTIWLSTALQDNNFYIRIADNGIGIPKEEVEKLFTKFYRASNAAKHQAEGTGLGLYVVRQALELLNGTVTVETDSEQGAEFVVTIPLSL